MNRPNGGQPDILAHPRLQTQVSLLRYTAARMGGPAEYFYLARPDDTPEDIAALVLSAWDAGLPVHFLGAGANVLVSDAGVSGLVLVNHHSRISFFEDSPGLQASSGISLVHLARLCAERGLAGMEWAVGVPGTLGGAIVNNAGAHGTDMAASVKTIQLLEADSGLHWLDVEAMQYAYRASLLKSRTDRRFFVMAATLHLDEAPPEEIRERMAEFNAYRRRTQPPGASLGSIFKNPPGDYAGRLIESAGLKGFEMGSAQVSPVHANFIVNRDGEGRAADYFALIQHVRETVMDRHGVSLELEIELLGNW